MKKRLSSFGVYIFLIFSVWVVSCNSSKEIIEGGDNGPVIKFDSDNHVYTVKQGRSLLLEPAVTNNEGATYRWLLNGVTVGRELSYSFSSEEVGEHYMTFEVNNSIATVFEEIRIDVVKELLPYIALAVPDEGITLLVGAIKEFDPVVSNSDEAVYEWIVNGEVVGETKNYTFMSESPGEFEMEFHTENEDGKCSTGFTVTVLNAEDMPFSWEWDKDTYIMGLGRSVVLGPLFVHNAFEPIYSWYHENKLLQEGGEPEYCFKPNATGIYVLTITLSSEYAAITKDITVEVYDDEEANLRPITASSNIAAEKVWEFLPAPGQFVNERYSASDMREANAYAEAQLKGNKYVSLGAFGGYIIVQFDHSVINDGDYNIEILGNSFDGSSEPGIIWVMQDENGDGIPNDTWYELRGSEFGKPETWTNYAVTYYRPQNELETDYPWVDNRGNQGVVERNRWHQGPYYPEWVTADSYTLYGTRLEPRVTYSAGAGWRNESYEWGYSDNFGLDRLTDDDNYDADINANHFKISHAVDKNGHPVHLKYIDFVKVHTAVQAMAGNLGEVSTEVFGFRDYNMIK